MVDEASTPHTQSTPAPTHSESLPAIFTSTATARPRPGYTYARSRPAQTAGVSSTTIPEDTCVERHQGHLKSSDAGAVTRSANATTSTSRMSTDSSWPQCLQQAALCDDTFAEETQRRDCSRHRRARPCTPFTTPPCLPLPVTAANTSTRTCTQGVGASQHTMIVLRFAAVVCVLVGLLPARMAEIECRRGHAAASLFVPRRRGFCHRKASR